jgi:anion-transporting  ArsA/GET3 family ATPase
MRSRGKHLSSSFLPTASAFQAAPSSSDTCLLSLPSVHSRLMSRLLSHHLEHSWRERCGARLGSGVLDSRARTNGCTATRRTLLTIQTSSLSLFRKVSCLAWTLAFDLTSLLALSTLSFFTSVRKTTTSRSSSFTTTVTSSTAMETAEALRRSNEMMRRMILGTAAPTVVTAPPSCLLFATREPCLPRR